MGFGSGERSSEWCAYGGGVEERACVCGGRVGAKAAGAEAVWSASRVRRSRTTSSAVPMFDAVTRAGVPLPSLDRAVEPDATRTAGWDAVVELERTRLRSVSSAAFPRGARCAGGGVADGPGAEGEAEGEAEPLGAPGELGADERRELLLRRGVPHLSILLQRLREW